MNVSCSKYNTFLLICAYRTHFFTLANKIFLAPFKIQFFSYLYPVLYSYILV